MVQEAIEYEHDDVLRAMEAHTCHVRGWSAAKADLTFIPAKGDFPSVIEVKVVRVPSPEDCD